MVILQPYPQCRPRTVLRAPIPGTLPPYCYDIATA